MDRLRTFGLAGAGGIFVISAVVTALGTRADGGSPGPPTIPRGIVIGLLLAVPAIVALVGVRRRDRVLLTAAGFAVLAPFWLSYATLPLVIPGLLLFVAAGAATQPTDVERWLVAFAIVGLEVGAIWALLGNTETRCWLAYETADGGLVYQPATPGVEGQILGLPNGPVASGCDGGALTERGAALAGVLAIGALAVAFGVPARRRTPTAASPPA
jgi:hypothetical protein